MKIQISGCIASLKGDWTFAGVTQSAMDSLAVALQQIESCRTGGLHIDCRDVSAIDLSGQQILSVWMQCASLRGVESELFNPPNKLRQAFRNLGLQFRDTPPNTPGNNLAKTTGSDACRTINSMKA